MKSFFNEIKKLTSLCYFFFSDCYRAYFLKTPISRARLTQIFLWSESKKSQIKSKPFHNIPMGIFSLESFTVSDLYKPPQQKLCLQTIGDLVILLNLFTFLKPKNIFEFGIYKGGTTALFAINKEPEARLTSLDLTLDHLDSSLFQKYLNNSSVKLIENDSHSFDFEHFIGSQDFIFIDGGHEYSIVKNDSENAMKMLSRSGVIIWDDYSPSHPEVFNYLNELSLTTQDLYHIENTSLVILDKYHRLS